MHATKHWGQNLYKVTFNFRVQYANNEVHMGAIGGKTGKTADLPKFCKIERVGGVLPCYRGFTWLGRACHAGGAPAFSKIRWQTSFHSLFCDRP
jgi:hypothetical protein